MSFHLGLTGSIGMGKSATAQLFAEFGCAVWDADAAVHRLYAKGGAAVEPIAAAFPTALDDGAVDRARLKDILSKDATALKKIEAIVHPLVGQDREAFKAAATAEILVFDIPLMFETGGNKRMDAVVCVDIDPEEQARRVLARGTMTEDQFKMILETQMPNSEKCALSDYVVVTDTPDHARAQVAAILEDIRRRMSDA